MDLSQIRGRAHGILSIRFLGLFYTWTFMAVLKLWQFSGSTPMTRTSGRMVLMARAVPVNHKIIKRKNGK